MIIFYVFLAVEFELDNHFSLTHLNLAIQKVETFCISKGKLQTKLSNSRLSQYFGCFEVFSEKKSEKNIMNLSCLSFIYQRF